MMNGHGYLQNLCKLHTLDGIAPCNIHDGKPRFLALRTVLAENNNNNKINLIRITCTLERLHMKFGIYTATLIIPHT